MKLFRCRRTRDPAPLTPKTEQHVATLFSPADREEARDLLVERCGRNLPLLERSSPVELERFRFAALKLSRGDLALLKSAIDLAQIDWRDLLISADFAEDIDAHESWRPGEPAA